MSCREQRSLFPTVSLMVRLLQAPTGELNAPNLPLILLTATICGSYTDVKIVCKEKNR